MSESTATLKFKQGDRVRVTEANGYTFRTGVIQPGSLGTVEEVTEPTSKAARTYPYRVRYDLFPEEALLTAEHEIESAS